MTVRQLVKQLSPYENEDIEQVVTESGENIVSVYQNDTYVVLVTSEIDDSLTVDGIIANLGQCDHAKEVVTDSMAEICSVAYECIVNPTVYLKHHA